MDAVGQKRRKRGLNVDAECRRGAPQQQQRQQQTEGRSKSERRLNGAGGEKLVAGDLRAEGTLSARAFAGPSIIVRLRITERGLRRLRGRQHTTRSLRQRGQASRFPNSLAVDVSWGVLIAPPGSPGLELERLRLRRDDLSLRPLAGALRPCM